MTWKYVLVFLKTIPSLKLTASSHLKSRRPSEKGNKYGYVFQPHPFSGALFSSLLVFREGNFQNQKNMTFWEHFFQRKRMPMSNEWRLLGALKSIWKRFFRPGRGIRKKEGRCGANKLLYISGWWQLKYFFVFTPKIGEMIQFDWYFSNGLKPSICFSENGSLRHGEFYTIPKNRLLKLMIHGFMDNTSWGTSQCI